MRILTNPHRRLSLYNPSRLQMKRLWYVLQLRSQQSCTIDCRIYKPTALRFSSYYWEYDHKKASWTWAAINSPCNDEYDDCRWFIERFAEYITFYFIFIYACAFFRNTDRKLDEASFTRWSGKSSKLASPFYFNNCQSRRLETKKNECETSVI